ncbi:MAG TPA: glycosyltransferase [Phototrophicaceae bacterium]|nr:glycosyltransferase [Phototrophicaceae bacterium]
MRILIAVHGFPPTHSAGAERRAERMAHWFIANGHDVEVFAIEKLDEPGFRVESTYQDGMLIHRLFYDVSEGDDPFRNLYDYAPLGAALREILKRQRFDLVHIVSGYLLGGQVVEAAHDFGLPVVLTLTEYWFMCARLNLIQATNKLCAGPERNEKCTRCLMEYKRRYRIPSQATPKLMDFVWSLMHLTPVTSAMSQAVDRRQFVLREALDAVDLVICPSQYLIDKFSEFGFNTERYLFVRQGLATPANSRPNRERQPGEPLRIGYVGQIKPHKGVDLLIEAVIGLLQQGQPVSLNLWGTETEAPEYVATLKKLSAAYSAIRWNGRYLGPKVWEVLADFDALVIPSRWYENSPNAILEAFEMRIPVVATRLGGMAELVEHEKSGLLFELDNAADLRVQLQRLVTEPDLLNQLRSGIPPVKTIHEEMQEILVQYHHLLQRTF